MAAGALSAACQLKRGSIHKENVRPAIIVVIKAGHAGAGGFDYVCFWFTPPKMSVIVRPAFEAMSSNWASGGESFAGEGLLTVCAVATRPEQINAKLKADNTRRPEVENRLTLFMSPYRKVAACSKQTNASVAFTLARN